MSEAKSSNVAYYIRLSVTLFVISFVVALLLGVVNGVTKDKIKALKEEKTAAALAEVLPDCKYEAAEVTDDMVAAATTYESEVAAVYTATDASGKAAGYVFEVVPSGFGGSIDMVVGIDANGNVTGVKVVTAAETAGVGSKVTSNKNNKNGVPVLGQFAGKNLKTDGELTIGKNVDAISGATVSSKAVTRGVNAALAAHKTLG